jgi:cytochrome c peroxidase
MSGCADCHSAPNFSDDKFYNIGIGMDLPNPDTGRFAITNQASDWGAFKVPTLREVTHTGPYMHDGSIKTLEEVIEYYDKGGNPNKNLHPLIHPLYLTASDKLDLIAFLKTLNGEGWQHFQEPAQFPQ